MLNILINRRKVFCVVQIFEWRNKQTKQMYRHPHVELNILITSSETDTRLEPSGGESELLSDSITSTPKNYL